MSINNGNTEDKITITIVFEDKETIVSWHPLETNLKDAKFMFLCTCDSLTDSHFEIYDSNDTLIDPNAIDHFDNNSIFYLQKSENETKPISNLLLNDKRKLYVEIEPLKHIEAETAIKFICVGSNILKQTKKGIPHIKLFQLSSDLKRILWYSQSKKINKSQISLESIKDISLGQISPLFQKFPIKSLEEFSFSIYYYINNNAQKNKDKDLHTLDLICKDEREFDIWLIGIKALHSHYNSKIISKHDLLSHSSNYQKQIQKGNLSNCSTFLFYSDKEYTPKGKCLEKILITRDISLYTLTRRMYSICDRHMKILEQMIKFNDEEEQNNKELALGVNENGYQELFNEETVDDIETQKAQIEILYHKCVTSLTISFDDFFLWYDLNKNNTQAYVPKNRTLSFGETLSIIHSHYSIYLPYKSVENNTIKDKIESDNFLKELDIRLWEIEINFEQILGIINQFNCANTSFLSKIKGLFK